MLPKEQSDRLWGSYLCDTKTFNCRRHHMRVLQKPPAPRGKTVYFSSAPSKEDTVALD